MNGGLNPDDNRPPYQQVADSVRQAISSGDLKPGAKLPPHHAVVGEFGVSLGTVKRAYGVLQADGLIVTRQGQGSYVRSQPTGQPANGRPAGREAESPGIQAQLSELRSEVADLAVRVRNLESHGSKSTRKRTT